MAPNMATPTRKLTTAATTKVRMPEQAQREDRLGGPALDDDEGRAAARR